MFFRVEGLCCYGLGLMFPPAPPAHHLSPLPICQPKHPQMPLPFREPLYLFTLEGGGMLQCHPESGHCCFPASSDLPQGSKGRGKLGRSMPAFPLWSPVLSLWAAICCAHWSPNTTLLERISQSVYEFPGSITPFSFCGISSIGFGRENKELV